MELKHGLHLAYCTNIHRGETWGEVFRALETHVMAVRRRVCPADKSYAIGLRLGVLAADELARDGADRLAFQRWLEKENCYVFTINGFPYGKFHGQRVKEQVFLPDWSSPERLEYTNRLFDLIAEIVPAGVAGSVSTLPGSHKELVKSEAQEAAIRRNLWECFRHIEKRSASSGRELHLGLEPEPLGYFETSGESAAFFARMDEDFPETTAEFRRFVGLNYDTCHLGVEYEEPAAALGNLAAAGIRISKLHLSSALALKPVAAARARLASFADDVYFHQTIIRRADGTLRRVRDLPEALALPESEIGEEWRVHFHVPLHHEPDPLFGTTRDHLSGVLDALQAQPGLCQHLEMETYTWEVLPENLRSGSVEDQLVNEYAWTVSELGKRGLA